MKKSHATIRSSATSSSSQLGFFSEENDRTNALRPLYLFCTEEASNKLFLFISSSRWHCWVKEGNVWGKLEIQTILSARDGSSKTYCFDGNVYDIDTLTIPFPFKNNATYTSERKNIRLTAINLSQDELECNDITYLEALDLSTIPETREQAQQQLKLTEKKQALQIEIQKIESIVHSLQHALETILQVQVPVNTPMQPLMDKIHYFQKIKSALCEEQSLLENPPEAKQPHRPMFARRI